MVNPPPSTDRWAKPTIVGSLVTLRPIADQDAEAMFEAVNDPESNDLTATEETFTYEQICDWCATRGSQDGRLDLAIVENVSGEYAGEVVLNSYDPDTESTNFRIALRGPAWFGRGLGSEATALLLQHAFAGIGLRQVTLAVLARNPRARRTYEKAGFRTRRAYVEDGQDWLEMIVDTP